MNNLKFINRAKEDANYHAKYIKYKNKYTNLKMNKIQGGGKQTKLQKGGTGNREMLDQIHFLYSGRKSVR